MINFQNVQSDQMIKIIKLNIFQMIKNFKNDRKSEVQIQNRKSQVETLKIFSKMTKWNTFQNDQKVQMIKNVREHSIANDLKSLKFRFKNS